MSTGKYLKIFAQEAGEHLESMRKGILALEKEGFSPETLRELLRNVHTLKGSASLLDLGRLGTLAHRMEDLLKELEGGRPFSPSLADLLLHAADALEALVTEAHSGQDAGVDLDAILEALSTGEVPEKAEPPQAEPAAAEQGEHETIRIGVDRIDRLVNLLGETHVFRGIFEERSRQAERLRKTLEEALRQASFQQGKKVLEGLTRLSLDLQRETLDYTTLSEDLHRQAMELRMRPFASVTEGFSRSVRDLARDQGKKVDLRILGEEVELDRHMLEAVKPMLLHMVRNAVDHGIETPGERLAAGKAEEGLVELSARYEGGYVKLTLVDDGRGIDPEIVRRTAVERRLISPEEARSLGDEEAIYLIMRPGFSTRQIITDVSGRGVGMDVVKSNLDRVKGNLTIASTPGEGAEVCLMLPLTLAVVKGLVVDCEGECYVIPLHYVTEVLRLGERDIMTEGDREVVRVRDTALPLLSLQKILDLPRRGGIEAGSYVPAVVLDFRGQKIALLVTRSLGVQELVVKTMGRQLKSVELFSGATILGDGSPALFLSIADTFHVGLGAKGTTLLREFEESRQEAVRGRLLVVDDSITTRTMEKNILETQGYEVDVAVSGQDALAKVAQTDYDLIVSDVEMPGMTGFELTAKLREMESTREVPVVIVTSRSSDEDKRKGIEVGAQAYIVKGSFDQGTLLQAVESLVG